MARDNTDLNAGGVKYDTDKIRMDLLPPDAEMAIAAVFTYGAEKYDDWNWAKGMRAGRLYAAMQRHMSAFMLGEEFDAESGMPHLWHAGCCIMMMIAADLRACLIDDRPASWNGVDTDELQALNLVHSMFKHRNDPAESAPGDWETGDDWEGLESIWDDVRVEPYEDPEVRREAIREWRQELMKHLTRVDFRTMVELPRNEDYILDMPQPDPRLQMTEDEGRRIIQEVVTLYMNGPE